MADLNPVVGKEQRGTRPVVIISGDAMNTNLGISIVCPLSSKVKHFAGCLVITPDSLNGLSEKSEIISFQVRTISHSRLTRKIGSITTAEIELLRKGLLEILSY